VPLPNFWKRSWTGCRRKRPNHLRQLAHGRCAACSLNTR
jgi:hypothetical protein